MAAAIVFLVMSALVANDPRPCWPTARSTRTTPTPTLYTELGLVTLALALVMLGGAWFRKRLVIGIASALYGLSFFNLHYWGFGVPYIMIGAWYMVRAYRLSQKLKWPRRRRPPTLGPSGRPGPAQQAVHAPDRPDPPAHPSPSPAKGTEAG